MDVTVVGAGVVGLTTALVLERAGHRVQVVAAARGDAIVSSVAGAIWLPYRCGPAERVAVWAAATRAWLVELAARTPEAGVDVLDGYELVGGDERPWWCAAAGEVARAPAPVTGAPLAWHYAAPRVEPAVHLAWLEAQLGRPIDRRVVGDLAAEPGDAIINCTGLGARALCGDRELAPLLGQVVIVEQGELDLGVSIGDARDPDSMFYAIPRRSEVVLGGCALPWPADVADAPADPAISERILAHTARLGLAPGRVLTTRVGLRPFRAEVRLERDAASPRVVHCYGHGGGGFTLARGCALDVAALLATA